MIGRTIRIGWAFSILVAAGLSVACGSGDSGSASSSANYGDLVAAIKSPTGTVSAATAPKVADEFEKVNSSGLSGSRRVQESQDVSSQVCTSGGTAKAEGSGSESSGNVTINYGNCCMAEGCCINGMVNTVYNSSSDSSSGYSYCMNYDVSVKCNNDQASVKSAGCLNSSGEFVYSITVESKTYTVSGSYSGGSGKLTITGANGTWTCTYTNGAGTCTGTGGDFKF